MKKTENASISLMKIICITIILILISGIGVMAANTNLKDIKIVLQNGYELTALTSKETVGDVLKENNITVDEDEKTIPDINEKVDAGATIKIVNKSYNEVQIAKVSEDGAQATLDDLLNNYASITEKIVTEQTEIPFETITKNVAGTEEDTKSKVLQEGQNGIKETTYKIKYQNDVEIDKIVISEKVVKEPVNKIVQVTKNVTSRSGITARVAAATNATATANTTTAKTTSATASTSNSGTRTGAGKWSYSASDIDLMCAITAQESGSSYAGALAVITTACNRAESSKWKSRGSDPLSQYKAAGQFCYSLDSHWKNKLNGNYPSYVKQAVTDALNGTRNHNYLSFRAGGTHAGTYIGGNVYF